MAAKQTNDKISLAIAINDINTIKMDVHEIKEKLEQDYVTKLEFDPIKKVVYGLVALILTIVISALVYVVVIK